MSKDKISSPISTTSQSEDFEVVISNKLEDDMTILTTTDIINNKLISALKDFDPENRKYSTYLSEGTNYSTQVTSQDVDMLADGAQSDIKKILSINSIIRKAINVDDIIGRTYESIETNVSTEFTLSYKDFKGKRNKSNSLDRTKVVIDDFNERINLESLLRRSITTPYSEGTYIMYLRGEKGNYFIDYFPLGVALVSDYEVNGNPCILIDIRELTSRLRKTQLKSKKGSALFFDKIEDEIKNNYPKEVYDAYIAKEQYAKLDIERTGVVRIGNLNRKYGLSPIFKAIKPSLMLEIFDNADGVNTKAKAKKIIHQILRKELMGTDGATDTYTQMAYAHDNLMKAWKMNTVVLTTPAYVEKIEYVEPKSDLTNVDTVNQYRTRVMSALGISFLNTDGKQTVSTAEISLTQLMKTINKISEQIEVILKRWYKIVLADNNVDLEYCPDIKIIDSELMEFKMKKELAEFLFTKLACSYKTAYKIVGIDIENEKQLREQEETDGIEEIFVPHPLAYTTSGNEEDTGKPSDPNPKDPKKQDYDKTRNKSKK